MWPYTRTHCRNGQVGEVKNMSIIRDNHKAKFAGGTDIAVEDPLFPQRLLEAAESVEKAIISTIFVDDRQLNAVCALYQKLCEAECEEGLKTLLLWLNGRPAIGGFRTIQAIMAHTNIVVPEACGVKLSKDSQKFVRDQVEGQRRITRGSSDEESKD